MLAATDSAASSDRSVTLVPDSGSGTSSGTNSWLGFDSDSARQVLGFILDDDDDDEWICRAHHK